MTILNAGNARQYFYRLSRVILNQPFTVDILHDTETTKQAVRLLYMKFYPKAKV